MNIDLLVFIVLFNYCLKNQKLNRWCVTCRTSHTWIVLKNLSLNNPKILDLSWWCSDLECSHYRLFFFPNIRHQMLTASFLLLAEETVASWTFLWCAVVHHHRFLAKRQQLLITVVSWLLVLQKAGAVPKLCFDTLPKLWSCRLLLHHIDFKTFWIMVIHHCTLS